MKKHDVAPEIQRTVKELLDSFPLETLPPEFRADHVVWIEDGHPSEFYNGVMLGLCTAASRAAKMGSHELSGQLMVMAVGAAIRYKESWSMEIKDEG